MSELANNLQKLLPANFTTREPRDRDLFEIQTSRWLPTHCSSQGCYCCLVLFEAFVLLPCQIQKHFLYYTKTFICHSCTTVFKNVCVCIYI